MATIVDALLVTLGLDGSAYRKGVNESIKLKEKLKKETKNEAKEREHAEKKVSEEEKKRHREQERRARESLLMYHKIRRSILMLGSAFMGGVGAVKFAEYAVSSTAALGRMSDVVGMSAKELSAWSLAAENAGGSGQAMLDTIKKMTSDVAAAKAGVMPDSMAMYQGLGGDPRKINNARSYLAGMANLIHRMNEQNPANALFRSQQMGVSYDAYNLLKRGWPALSHTLSRDAQLTGVNRGQTREAQRALEVWNGLKASFTQVGRKVFFAIAPWLDKLAAQLRNFALWLSGHGKDVQRVLNQFAKSIAQAATAIGHLTGLINGISDGAHSWSKFWQSGGSFWANLFHSTSHLSMGSHLLSGAGSGSHAAISHQTHINQMDVHTNASDAKGLLEDMRTTIGGNPLMMISNAW